MVTFGRAKLCSGVDMQGGIPRLARELTKPLAKGLLIVNIDVLSTEEDDASLGDCNPDQYSTTKP